MFLRMMGKSAPRRVEDFDMAARLKELQLDTLFPVALWPPTTATRKLYTKFKAIRRNDAFFNPFIFCELKEWAYLHGFC